MATPSFTILRSETTQTSITIRVYNYGYYIRLFLKNNATGDVETTGYSIWPELQDYTFSGLEPGTSYTINLGYNTTGSGGSQSVYGQDGYIFRTKKAGLTAYIYDNSYAWHLYLCYLYSSAGWVQYQPTIGGST